MKTSLVLAVLFMTGGLALAHDLQHEITRQDAVSVRLFYPDHSPFSYEAYEVYHVGDEIPFQTGRTDSKGRIVFLPDRAGEWRLRAFSEDGHGIDLTVETDDNGRPARSGMATSSRSWRIVTGLALLFGVFGIVSLLMGRRKK